MIKPNTGILTHVTTTTSKTTHEHITTTVYHLGSGLTQREQEGPVCRGCGCKSRFNSGQK